MTDLTQKKIVFQCAKCVFSGQGLSSPKLLVLEPTLAQILSVVQVHESEWNLANKLDAGILTIPDTNLPSRHLSRNQTPHSAIVSQRWCFGQRREGGVCGWVLGGEKGAKESRLLSG